MKHLLLIFALFFIGGTAYAGPMANVEYIHKVIEYQWQIKVPYNPKLESVNAAANMKYLLTAVDVANEILNGEKTTDYGNSEYATMAAADTVATLDAARRLIKIEPKFWATTTPDTTEFSFNIVPAGRYFIDWGDGNTETFVQTKRATTTYSHTYDEPGKYIIGIGGLAKVYYDNYVITFKDNKNLAAIDGRLGAIFRGRARFFQTFQNCTNLKGKIPENLFAGVKGAPLDSMFQDTFSGCSGLTGEIPGNLFAGIAGQPAGAMFARTFSGCSGLTGEIPGDLFAGIKGEPAGGMFSATFAGCSGLSGQIPGDLFADIAGQPTSRMFADTFSGCSGLTGEIPGNLFAGIKGKPSDYMFRGTFNGCSGLKGSIPEKLFGSLEGGMATRMFDSSFKGCAGLTGKIPDGLFGNIYGNPASGMFQDTFSGCSGLTGVIPDKLFGELSGNVTSWMFTGTFQDCSGLTGEIPRNLFGTMSGVDVGRMITYMFKNCTGLTGPSAQIGGKYLYEIWPDASYNSIGGCYSGATGLSDYKNMPSGWR